MRIKLITWRDSRMYLEQCPKESKFEVCEIESVGYLVEVTNDYYVLAADLVDDDIRRAIVIPKENVISCRNLSKVVE